MLCDPIWHVSSRSGEASRELLYSVYFTYFYLQLVLSSPHSCDQQTETQAHRPWNIGNNRPHLHGPLI